MNKLLDEKLREMESNKRASRVTELAMRHVSKIFYGMALGFAIGGIIELLGYQPPAEQKEVSRCEQIVRESNPQDYQSFCQEECRRSRLFELTDKFRLEDYGLARILAENRCNK